MQLTLTVITVVSSTSVRTQYTIYIWHSLLCPTVYREHSLRCLNKGVLVSARYDWAWGSGSSVVDQLGCSSLSRCTSTRTTVGGAAGTGQASVTPLSRGCSLRYSHAETASEPAAAGPAPTTAAALDEGNLRYNQCLQIMDSYPRFLYHMKP